MAKSHEINIRIIDATNRWPMFRSIVINASIVASLFGPGLLFGSAAMQWAGFVFWVVLVVLSAVALSQQFRAMTLEGARAKLDEIEAEQRGQGDGA